MPGTHRLRHVVMLLVALMLGGCGGGSSPNPTVTTTPEAAVATATPSPERPLPLVISPATATVVPAGSLTFTGTGGSPAYKFAIATNRSGGRIDAGNGVYRAGSTGDVADVVTMTDLAGNSESAIVNVGPSVALAPATATVAPKGTVTFSGTRGAGGYTYSIATNHSGASIGASSGIYVAGPNQSVTDVVKVTDRLGASVTAEVNVGPTVGITPHTATVAPRAELTFTAHRGSGTGYVFSLSSNLSGATLDPRTGAYVAGSAQNVTDVMQVTDSLGNSTTAEINVGPTVSITPQTATVVPRGALNFTGRGGSGTGYLFVLSTNLSGATIDRSSGAYVAGKTGNVADVVQVTDSLGNSISAEVNVEPTLRINPTAATVVPRGALSFHADLGSGTGYLFTLSTNRSGATIDSHTGAYVAGSTGNTVDVVEVTDSLGDSATAEVNVGPTLHVTPTTAIVAPQGMVTFTATLGSGTGYVFTLSTNLSGATVNPSTGAYVAGPTGNVTDVVEVSDSLGNSATAQVSVGPTVQISPTSTNLVPRGTELFTAHLGSGTGYVWSLPTNLSGATIDAATGAYQAGDIGDVTDVVEVTDSLGNTATATVNVGPVVTITPDGPSIGPLGSIAFTATGGSGSGFVWSLSSNLSGGSINASTGAYTAGATPLVTDVVSVTDSLGNSTTSLVGVGGNPFTVTAGAHTLNTDADTYDGNPVDGLAGGRWTVGNFTVVAGATVTVTGSRALVISSTGNIQIDGAILARGGNGANAVRAIPGAGGAAGPGGSAGGLGGDAVPNIGTAGQGPGGGGLGRGTPVVSGGGGGGGHATAGQAGLGQLVGVGGAAYGANDIPAVLVGGSGGGGGGRSSGAFTQGGGGGGGGGVVHIVTSVGTIVISATATIDVRGGNGGNGTTPASGNGASGGGGGAGGSVWLSGRVSPTVNGTILLTGGVGGLGLITGPPFVSGDGGVGASGTLVLQP